MVGITNQKRKYSGFAKLDPLPRAVVAFSFTPDEVSTQVEHGVPSVKSRIQAMHRLAGLGWKWACGLIHCLTAKILKNGIAAYSKIFLRRYPSMPYTQSAWEPFVCPSFYKKIEKQYQDEPFFAGNFATQKKYISYLPDKEYRLKQTCLHLLEKWVDPKKVFTCET